MSDKGEDMSELDWITGHDTGISSETIWSVMMGCKPPAWNAPPQDPSDFGRCYRLLIEFPAWRSRLGEVAIRHPEWDALVRHWDELETLWEQESPSGKCPLLYRRMNEVRQ